MCDYLAAALTCQAVADQVTAFPNTLVYGQWEEKTPEGLGRCAEGWIRHYAGRFAESQVGPVYQLAVFEVMEQIRSLGYGPYCTCRLCSTKGRSISIPEWNDKMKPLPSLVAQVCNDAANSLRRQMRGEMEKRAWESQSGTVWGPTPTPVPYVAERVVWTGDASVALTT